MKKIFENGEAKIEVAAHATSMAGTRSTDHLALITIFEGDRQAAENLFNQVVSTFKDKPYEDWLAHGSRF